MSNIDMHLLREKIANEVEQWKEKTANHYTIEAEARWSEANYILGILDSLRQEQDSVAEQFAKIVRANLPEIGNNVQSQFEQLYFEITGNKMYGGYND